VTRSSAELGSASAAALRRVISTLVSCRRKLAAG
jgi:hypothetical protein